VGTSGKTEGVLKEWRGKEGRGIKVSGGGRKVKELFFILEI